jgi:hypothetical protein
MKKAARLTGRLPITSVEHFEEVIEEYEAAEEAEAAGKDFKYRWVFPGKFDEPP